MKIKKVHWSNLYSYSLIQKNQHWNLRYFDPTGFWDRRDFWDWRDFGWRDIERRDFIWRDFETDGILFDGIFRPTGFYLTGFLDRRDFIRRDFETDGILFDGILSTGFWADWISCDGIRHFCIRKS